MVRSPDPRLLEHRAPYDGTVSGLVLALRAIVLEEAPEARELLGKGYAVAIGFTFTGKLKDCFCHIATYAHHVNFGFNRGTGLADPNTILTGTGKNIRHIRISSERDLALPYVRGFIRAAMEQVSKSGS
jgi:hypothetical protein